ncbi:MAG: esterase [Alphaproteobacteria bacterium]|nr:esterase [Alphaproteobacteria bacterium]MBU1516233.1 esterase [Alphaproteobacteria bacterium]MBU2095770.1 esterase [Alphaproteobacteria bacterium]MBU2151987.1 esterase [Alphaproteobacteria bacterium]MBU2306831.1 esterase [Alphaproteobacteria bacterium]
MGVAQTAAERLVVHSERVGRDFQIDVWSPVTRPWLPGQKAAAVYILDGGYGMAGPIASTLGGTNAMQPAYVVTVGYPPGKGAREFDLLFGPGTRPDGTVAKGGGAEAFTAFLVEELKPFIEARYPADPGNAVLMGHSLAGIYTANVLTRRPDAFAGYVIASPSLWADPQVIERLAAVRRGAGPPRRVFVAYGGAEAPYMIDGGRRVARVVAANRSFESRSQVFASEEHLTYYPALARAGLGALLPRKTRIDFPDPVALTPEVLGRYAGTYRFSEERTMTVTVEGAKLRATRTDRPPMSLSASAPDRFFADGMDIRLVFEGPATGPASAVTMQMNGDAARGVRAAP